MAQLKVAPIKTEPFIVSYPHLLVPQEFRPKPGELPRKPKYSCVAIFAPGTNLEPLKKAAAEARSNYFGNVVPRGLRNPFRKCEEMWKEVDGKLVPEPGYMAGGTFIALDFGDRMAPECWDQRGKVITDASVLYAGCKCIAVVRPTGYNFEEKNKGVKFYGLTLQKIDEGENIAGRVSAKDYFKPVEGLQDNATTGATTADGWDDDEGDESY